MMIVFSIIFSGVLFFFPLFPAFSSLILPMIILAGVIMILQGLVGVFFLAPLQKGERSLNPRLLELFAKDLHIKIGNSILTLFPLVTFFLIGLAESIHPKLLIAIWIIFFGLALDCLHYLYKRGLRYLDPYAALEMFHHAAISSVQDEREKDLCGCIDAISESAIKAAQRDNPSLANESLKNLQATLKTFFEASKSISHHSEDSQSQKMGITDKISYTLFYVLQRIELINQKALENGLEPVCSAAIINLGKITLHAANLDISLATYPLIFCEKCIKKSMEWQVPDIGGKATITLLNVAKSIPQEMDVTYLELKDPYQAIIRILKQIAQETFSQNKETPVNILKEPFQELVALFNTAPLNSHRDTPIILLEIKKVLEEFAALEMVLKTMPPLPAVSQDQESGA